MVSESSTASRILIVDDEPAICRIITRSLQSKGFEATSISEVAELRNAVSEGPYDAVLLDRSVHQDDGTSLVPLLRELLPAAKILFFTGEYVDADQLQEVDGVVQKPANGTELVAAIQRALGR
jgi:DNA-binding response OmpR family regulator